MKAITTLLLAAALIAAVGCDKKPAPPVSQMPAPPGGSAAAKVVDPVCKMEVAADAPLSATEGGKTYHFCSQGCLDKFKADPKQYAK